MLGSREVATYHALPRPKMDEEAQVMLPAEPPSSKMSKWMVRGVSGFLALGALATVCYLKFSPGSFGQADVLASQMKMKMAEYPACPVDTEHQCPQSWKSVGNPGVVGVQGCMCFASNFGPTEDLVCISRLFVKSINLPSTKVAT